MELLLFSHSVVSNSLRPHGCQASLSFTISWSLLKLVSIELVIPSNHLILCHPLLLLSSIFPSIRVFTNESVLHIGGQSIGASASALSTEGEMATSWLMVNVHIQQSKFIRASKSCSLRNLIKVI